MDGSTMNFRPVIGGQGRPPRGDARQKLQNEQRRAVVWQSERLNSNDEDTPRNVARSSTNKQLETIDNQNTGTGDFLREKQHIAGRSMQRMSSRRSLLSSSTCTGSSNRSLMSEKSAISERSERRAKARAANRKSSGASTSSPVPTLNTSASLTEEEEEEEEIDYYPKAGTAESVLPTLEECGMEISYRSESSAQASPPVPQTLVPNDTWYRTRHDHDDDEQLVMAVVVNDDEESPTNRDSTADIPYATAITEDTNKGLCWRPPTIAWLALACILLILINAGITIAVLKNQGSSDPSSDFILRTDSDATTPHQDSERPVDQDQDAFLPESIIPTPMPNMPPTKQPVWLNNGRPPPHAGGPGNKPGNGNGNSNGNANGGGNSNRPPSSAGASSQGKPFRTSVPSAAPIQPTAFPSFAPSQLPSLAPDGAAKYPLERVPSFAPSPRPSFRPNVAKYPLEPVLVPTSNPSSPAPSFVTPSMSSRGVPSMLPTDEPAAVPPSAAPSVQVRPVGLNILIPDVNRRPGGSLNPLVFGSTQQPTRT